VDARFIKLRYPEWLEVEWNEKRNKKQFRYFAPFFQNILLF